MTWVDMANDRCLVNFILRKFLLSLFSKSGSRLHRPTHTKVLEDAHWPSTLTSLWSPAWAWSRSRPCRKGLAWKVMRSSDLRSPPFCAVAASALPPEFLSLWGRTLPVCGWTVRRTLLAPLPQWGVYCHLVFMGGRYGHWGLRRLLGGCPG